MIDLRIPAVLALSLAVSVACSGHDSGSHGQETAPEDAPATELVQPAEVQREIEQALDAADAEITPANAEDELRKLESEIDADG